MTQNKGTTDDFVKGEPMTPHLKVGETIVVMVNDKSQKYKLVLTNKLDPRTLEPVVGLKVVG